MTKFVLLCGLLILTAAGQSPSSAADVTVWRGREPPPITFRVPPRSPEAAMVWASGACWRGCAQQCGWQFQTCLGQDLPGNCIAQNDACDRACQSQCRLYGGPLLPFN